MKMALAADAKREGFIRFALEGPVAPRIQDLFNSASPPTTTKCRTASLTLCEGILFLTRFTPLEIQNDDLLRLHVQRYRLAKLPFLLQVRRAHAMSDRNLEWAAVR
jgi:hypothetical protein